MYEVAFNNVSYSYGRNQVLRDITLKASAGDFICLLGPSGCGKSTLLRLLAGLAKPTSGRITLDRSMITGPGLDRGVVFQDYSLFPWMTTGQNIILALEQAFPGKKKNEYAIALLPTFRAASIFVIFIGAFWPIFINTVNGVLQHPQGAVGLCAGA